MYCLTESIKYKSKLSFKKNHHGFSLQMNIQDVCCLIYRI